MKVFRSTKNLARVNLRRLHKYHTTKPVGVDAAGVIHSLTWNFDETYGVVRGRCGATVDVKTRGTINCMTCLVKEAGFTP